MRFIPRLPRMSVSTLGVCVAFRPARLLLLMSTRSARLSTRSRRPLVLAARGFGRLTFAMPCGRPLRISSCASSLRLSTSFYRVRFLRPFALLCAVRPSWPFASQTGLFVPSQLARLSVASPARSPWNFFPSVHVPSWSLYSSASRLPMVARPLSTPPDSGFTSTVLTLPRRLSRWTSPTPSTLSIAPLFCSQSARTSRLSFLGWIAATAMIVISSRVPATFVIRSSLAPAESSRAILSVHPSLLWPFIRLFRRPGGILSKPSPQGSTSVHSTLTMVSAQAPLKRCVSSFPLWSAVFLAPGWSSTLARQRSFRPVLRPKLSGQAISPAALGMGLPPSNSLGQQLGPPTGAWPSSDAASTRPVLSLAPSVAFRTPRAPFAFSGHALGGLRFCIPAALCRPARSRLA